MKKLALLFLASGIGLALEARYVTETIELNPGWNGIYLESTPENAECEAFFAKTPVERVGAYLPDAYSSTAQVRSDGSEILQQPVSYYVWAKGAAIGSTLKRLVGGTAYLVYATAAAKISFYGIPRAPQMTWRVADAKGAGFMNLAGVSVGGTKAELSQSATTPAAYFGEGPFGRSGVCYQIAGTQPSGPTFLPMSFMGRPQLYSGRAYAFTAERAGDWPGVVGVTGLGWNGLADFGDTGTRVAFAVRNHGATNRTFRLTALRSAKRDEGFPPLARRVADSPLVTSAWSNLTHQAFWEVELAAGEQTTVELALDRRGMSPGAAYGAVIAVEDMSGGSAMRVRVPVAASAAATTDVTTAAPYPQGLWMGSVLLQRVNEGTNDAPVQAGGTMKATVLMHVDDAGRAQLLQRLAFAADSNGVTRLYRELSDAGAAASGARRVTSVMLDTANRQVDQQPGGAFGGTLDFVYVVGEKAVDNPFRHAWHPDHDGLDALYESYAPSGDDPANYVQGTVKPELWSISNAVSFAWCDADGRPYRAYDPDELTIGVVDWRAWGLKNAAIHMQGTFSMQRVLANGRFEKTEGAGK